MAASTSSSISQQVAAQLTPYIGQFNAQMWVKSVARRELGLSPEDLTSAHLPPLLHGLRPFLQALMGRTTTDELLQQLGREIH